MKLEFLLDYRLDEFLAETFYQVEFVFENGEAEEYLFVFELSRSKLEFADFSYFFYN